MALGIINIIKIYGNNINFSMKTEGGVRFVSMSAYVENLTIKNNVLHATMPLSDFINLINTPQNRPKNYSQLMSHPRIQSFQRQHQGL